jgi:hypothetical protein
MTHMNDPREPLPAGQTLLLIVLPMLATVIGLRLYLHFVHVQHVYPGGYLVHHLFLGVFILIPAAFLLAFGTRHRVLARVALGVGSGLILDEMVYLVATKTSDADYVSRVSVVGSVVLIAAAVVFLVVLYFLHRDQA